MTTIRAATESCIHNFAVVCHELEQHANLDTSGCEDINEASGRFRVWIGNLGALAKGHSALDWRLRDANVMRSTVLSLLFELQNTLELAFDSARDGVSEAFLGAEIDDDGDAPDDISLPSDDEIDAFSQPADGLNHLATKVQDLVKDLYKLSFRIRNSTSKPARAINYREIDTSSGLDIFGDCFAAFDRNHILELFGSLRRSYPSLTEDDNILVERFAKANTVRRRQFRYWQKHAQKLATTEVSELVVPIVAASANREEALKIHTPKSATDTHMSQSRRGKTIFTTTEATFFNQKLDLTTFETQSVVSSATTARDLEGKPADLPPRPAAALNGQDFVCHYCYVLCPSTHGHGRAWRKHILQDLQPYLCTYIDCYSADRLYGSRREWLEHEDNQHRRLWVCRFHPSVPFSNQHDFEQHLRQQGHGNVTDAQVKDFASIAQSIADDTRQKCPVCLEETASIPQFPAHLAHHLERIATFSIPREVDEEDTTSLTSFKAIPRSMSDRTSLDSEFSAFSSQDSAAGSDHVIHERTLLKDDILQWFNDISGCDLGPPQQSASSLDPAMLYAFLESPEYGSWYNMPSPRRLVCCAEVDAQKTLFSSAVYQDLNSRIHPGAFVICAFLPHKRDTNLTLTQILTHLTGQLIAQISLEVIHDKVVDFYHRFRTFATKPSSTVLFDLIDSLRDSTSRVYLVLDAPDQSSELIASLLDVVSKAGNLCVMISSSNRVIEPQDDQITIDIDALYSLDHRKRSFSRAMDSKIAEIQNRTADDDQRQSPLIDEAFERIMSHTIKSSTCEDLAMAAFDVVRHAFSPLRGYQFKRAVRHILRQRRPHPITYPTITDVIEATGGLLTIQDDSVITWFHPSLSGYFERTHARWFPSGHASMALACLTVLMSQAIPTDADGTGNWATGSLFGYAACLWGRHLRACSPNPVLEAMAMRYLEDDEKLKLGCLTAYTLQSEYMAYGFDVGDGLAVVHVCCIFGLTNLLQDLSVTELNRQVSSTGCAPLVYACRMGHIDTLELLLRRGADPNLVSAGGYTALNEAVISKCIPAVELLLRSPSLKLRPSLLLVSLLQLQSLEILRLALNRHDLDINEKDHNGRTVIWWLLRATHDEYDTEFQSDAMQLIVQHPDCDINAVDLGGRTYIMRLLDVRIQETKLLGLLLENRADVNYMDEDGETAMFHAVTTRYSLEITSLLIRHGADLARKNRWGQGLSHRLVADIEDLQDLQYLDLLLKHMPALIDTQDDRGRTSLHLALVFGKIEIAKELLSRAANVRLLDNSGRAPFDVACQYGRTTTLSRLVPVGIYKTKTNPKAEQSGIASQTPRSVPLRSHPLPSRDRYSGYPEPLSRMLSYERPEHRVEWLPDPPVYLHSQPTELVPPVTSGREADIQWYAHTASTAAAAHGQVLLELHLDKLPGWSLGYLGRFDKLFMKLEQSRLDPLEPSPDNGNTALHTTIKSTSTQSSDILAFRHRVFEELLASVKGNCSPQNGCQETPLHTAVLSSQSEMALMLIKAGADLTLRDNLERTPLDLAKELEQDEVVAAIQRALRKGSAEH